MFCCCLLLCREGRTIFHIDMHSLYFLIYNNKSCVNKYGLGHRRRRRSTIQEAREMSGDLGKGRWIASAG